MPSTDVELSGMTINLVETKYEYDAMTKSSNELYFVEGNYDLAIVVEYIWNDSTRMYDVDFEIEEGSIKSVLDMVHQDNTYIPKVKINFVNHYSNTIYNESYIVDCITGRRSTYCEILLSFTGTGAGTYPLFGFLYVTNIQIGHTFGGSTNTASVYLERGSIDLRGTFSYDKDALLNNYTIPYV